MRDIRDGAVGYESVSFRLGDETSRALVPRRLRLGGRQGHLGMDWLRIAALIVLPAQALAHPQGAEVPSWMVRGFEAAIADPTPGVASGALDLPLAYELLARSHRAAAPAPSLIRSCPCLGTATKTCARLPWRRSAHCLWVT